MVNLKEIKWESLKALCDRVEGIESRANKIGLLYVFNFEIGIYECRVYSVLYKSIGGCPDIDLAKYYENDYFGKRAEFDSHLAEIERILSEGYDVDKAYAEELSKLNKKYGK